MRHFIERQKLYRLGRGSMSIVLLASVLLTPEAGWWVK
jgi:hypothetical protein